MSSQDAASASLRIGASIVAPSQSDFMNLASGMRIEIEPRFAVHFPQIGEQRIVVQRVDARPAVIGRPLSRGSNPCSCPHEPLVSYRINRQLSGWNPPPLMMRAFGAHCHELTTGTGAISANQPEN
jgi:hypothetical protein